MKIRLNFKKYLNKICLVKEIQFNSIMKLINNKEILLRNQRGYLKRINSFSLSILSFSSNLKNFKQQQLHRSQLTNKLLLKFNSQFKINQLKLLKSIIIRKLFKKVRSQKNKRKNYLK